MATKNTTAPAVEVLTIDGPSTQEIVSEGIAHVIETTGIDVQKSRYKAMRAIAWQAFAEAVESGTFEELVDRALANVHNLPNGWELQRPERVEAAPAKRTATKTTTAAKAR